MGSNPNEEPAESFRDDEGKCAADTETDQK